MRVPLPTYPFERRRYWVEPRMPRPSAGERPAGAPAPEALRRGPRPNLLTEHVPPAGDLELRVAEVWEELLGIEGIGAYDNFLELGGHSLLGIRVLARLREQFQVELPADALYSAPTVSEMAALVEAVLLAEIEALGEEELLRLT
uniref:Non-ribosomal peptide synthase n=1 Tax=uncultured bacterium esnapd24 TaxID=1366606 RepID=S5TNC1_9BACT|nr:non-ribosomal peptide synthase [uncultured bacterium esnapd24]